MAERLAKVLFFDASGTCVLQNELDRGRFALPEVAEDVARVVELGGRVSARWWRRA